MDLVVDQVAELEHVDVANRHTLFERLAGDTVIQQALPVLGEARLFEHLADFILVGAFEDRRREAHVELVTGPAEVGLEDLPDIHPRRHAERIENDLHRCPVGQERHVLFWEDLRDNALVSMAAGAPFLPKLVEVAKGNTPFSVGLMVLLMVVTVIYLPIVLPLLLSGVEVNPLDIASSLVFTMLVPLAIGLFIKARYADTAVHLQPTFAQASNTSLMLMMGILLLLNVRNILSFVGTGALVAGIIFIVLSFVTGYLLGGPGSDTKAVLGLGTGQRNIAAALVVAGQNFSDPDVLIMLIVVAILGLFILMPLGGEWGKRKVAAEAGVA